MSAEQFKQVGLGVSVKEAFDAAVSAARYDYGHAGNTGTLADKDEFVVISDEEGRSLADASALADQLLRDDDERIDDKWGPAGAIRFDEPDHPTAWLFFGWASS
jgi:hypothetical protein